ncbi:helix-turn-helix transcriptional regulator [Saccharibacillus sacchari]|uniref:helix-turn-helix transcriptional regulator n=1 Tax=Saccharibacillus sacchari TaxID=456493 RepID=UPI0004B9D904|nr:AraC family transcriptional regulator [Saccharibacillus sacchari]
MKKRNSVWARLAVSYLSVVLVIVLSLCSVFYIYSSNRYMSELQDRNQATLANTAKTIDSEVFQRVQQVVLGLALDRTSDLRQFQGDSWKNHPSRLLELQQLLKAEVSAQPDLIEAIHLYDPQSGAMLSSLHGLVDRNHRERNMPQQTDWIASMSISEASGMWTGSRIIPEDVFSEFSENGGQKLMTYAHSYPFQSSGADSDLIVAIDVKEESVQAIIRNMLPFQYEETWSLGASGELAIGTEGSADLRQQTAQTEASAGLPINSDAYTIFHEPLPTTGWTLYSATPHSFFQEQSLATQRLVLAISAVALLIGLLLSGVMTKLIYSPLKRLVANIRQLTGQSDTGANEYGIINTAVHHLNEKVSTLEENLRATGPIVKRNMILQLLQGDQAEQSIKERTLVENLFGEADGFRCLLLHIHRRPGAREKLEHGAATTRADIALMLEHMRLPGILIVAEELPDKKIAAILARTEVQYPDDAFAKTATCDEDWMRTLADRLLNACEEFTDVSVQLAWGREVMKPDELHTSRSDAESRIKYAYFLPERPLLHEDSLAEREDSQDELPQPILARFREKLPGRQFDEIAESIDTLIEAMREGNYPADYCHFILSNTVFAFSDYLKSIRYKQPGGGHPDLHRQYIALSHIDEFRAWLLDSVRTFLAETEKRSSERAKDTLESAKQYIEEHLPDDLSLEAVSSNVFISAKYLSRLFKEELGVTYTEYVTKRRMETAKELIERGGATIEQIAGAVGYSTTAYFIKKFKEAYGCTPGNYLRESRKQA